VAQAAEHATGEFLAVFDALVRAGRRRP